MKRFFSILMILIILMQACAFADVTYKYLPESQKQFENFPVLGSKAVYIAEPTTGKVIYEKNAHEKMYPASTTKILTALLVMENCDLSEIAVVSKHALELVPDGYSNAKLKAGEEFDVKTLLYALLVPSANEAANVLAEHVSGSIENFVELCNKRAQELGCETLHFTNANGIHDENHYCSAYDLYLIAKECKKHDIFNEIVKTSEFTVPGTSVHPNADRTFKSTNELLLAGRYYYENCTGIKTGYTTPAGECLVGSAYKDGIELISVVLGGKTSNSKGLNERFADTKELYSFTFDNYSLREISNLGDVVATLNVGKATKETSSLEVIVDSTISTIVPNEIDKNNIYSTIAINPEIVAPIDQDDVLGTITYYADGLIYTTNLIASHSVKKLPYGLYNVIIVGVVCITFLGFISLVKKSRKKNRIKTLFFVIAVIEICVGIMIMQEGKRNSITTAEVEAKYSTNKNGESKNIGKEFKKIEIDSSRARSAINEALIDIAKEGRDDAKGFFARYFELASYENSEDENKADVYVMADYGGLDEKRKEISSTSMVIKLTISLVDYSVTNVTLQQDGMGIKDNFPEISNQIDMIADKDKTKLYGETVYAN